MRCIMKNCPTLFALVAVLTCFVLIAGCASYGRLSQPTAVPEIRPGVPAGYLPRNALPNSLTLLPLLRCRFGRSDVRRGGQPKGSRFARYAPLEAGEGGCEPHVSPGGGTFSCVLNVPVTKQDTPHLYMRSVGPLLMLAIPLMRPRIITTAFVPLS